MATLFDKLWRMHRVADAGDGYDLLAVDRLLLHERTGGVALKSLKEQDLPVVHAARCFTFMDHIVSFRAGRARNEARSPGGETFILETRRLSADAGIRIIDTDSPEQGIVHVAGPELGIVLPGFTVMCPDSHTCSLGALGALAWGIGSSEAEHILATGTIRARKPQQMRIRVTGELRAGITAKDLALFLIARHGAQGGNRCAIEFCGSGVDALSVEGRLTLCNMAVEFAAYTALIAPDERTLDFVRGRQLSPAGEGLVEAQTHWRTLSTDAGAVFDREITLDAGTVTPQVSWGTSPEETVALDACVPEGSNVRALSYMGLASGQRLEGLPIQGAFIGSCTNGRLSDLKIAADQLRGKKLAAGVRGVCVPGSQSVKREAERLFLDRVFIEAGFEWGEPGCAMCFYAGGETFPSGARVLSSTNRNFEGRQGPGVRTHLSNPAVVAASAVAGYITMPQPVEPVGETA